MKRKPGHFHANLNGEGSCSWNVHEVGRFIAEEGSNSGAFTSTQSMLTERINKLFWGLIATQGCGFLLSVASYAVRVMLKVLRFIVMEVMISLYG